MALDQREEYKHTRIEGSTSQWSSVASCSWPCFSPVSAHGGMLGPPIWQDGVGLSIEEANDFHVWAKPVDGDPKTGRLIIYWQYLPMDCGVGICWFPPPPNTILFMVWGKQRGKARTEDQNCKLVYVRLHLSNAARRCGKGWHSGSGWGHFRHLFFASKPYLKVKYW